MSNSFRDTIIWLFCSALGLAVALIWTSGSLIDGGYIPMGVDSFLHARRILDTVADTSAFHQWDVMSFAPEGAYNHWPWSYDMSLALLTRFFMLLSGLPANTVLMHIPPAWVFINAALILGICNQLRLHTLSKTLAMVSFFLSPLTQGVHGVGHVDHNFLELSFVLLSVWAALVWVNNNPSVKSGVIMGLILGAANGVNISMFLLQLPLLALVGYRWVRGEAMSRNALVWCAGVLAASTLLICLPSEPLQAGYFRHYYLSWFQVYVALCTGSVLIFCACVAFSRNNMLLLILLSICLTLPMIGEIVEGGRYLATSDSLVLSHIEETKSLFDIELTALVIWYSGFVFLLPLCLLGCVVLAVRNTDQTTTAFCIYCAFGLGLALAQYRFNHFGSYGLYLLPFFLFELTKWSQSLTGRISLVAVVLLMLAPSIPFTLLEREAGWSDVYRQTRPLYIHLTQRCEEQPGIVLTPLASANYVRYHTDCSVLGTAMFGANNRQTHQGERALRLLNSDPTDTLHSTPEISYVLAVKSHGTRQDKPDYAIAFNQTGLNGLLFDPGASIPAGFTELLSVEYMDNEKKQILARLLKVDTTYGTSEN